MRKRHRAHVPAMLLVLGTMLQSTLLAVALTFGGVAYPAYVRRAAAWGVNPMADQQLAGTIMWIPSAIAYLIVFGIVFVRWFGELDARHGRRPAAGPTTLLALPLLMIAGSACSYFGGRTTRYQPPGIHAVASPGTGREWYQRDCAWCHGARGEGTQLGPDLRNERNGPALTDFMLRTGRMPVTDPGEPVRGGPPAYDAAIIRQIVDYVATFGGTGPAVPVVDASRGDLAKGQQLYQTNCAACHSVTGVGGALAGQTDDVGGDVATRSEPHAPGIKRSTPLEIAEAMRVGPGTMPVFGSKTFGDEDVNAIVRYVMYLQDPANPGGGDLGGVGPVAEGALAWAVGLGALLLLTRWIGKTVHDDE
jgi:ubiquinol-cytochrome c reductase cytochrome c subunit